MKFGALLQRHSYPVRVTTRLRFFVCGYREPDTTGRSSTGDVICGGVVELTPHASPSQLASCPRCGLPYEVAMGAALAKETSFYQSTLMESYEYRHMLLKVMGSTGAVRVGFGSPGADLMVRPGDDLVIVFGLSLRLPRMDASMHGLALAEGPWEYLTPAHPKYQHSAELGVLLVKNETTGHVLEAAPFWRRNAGPFALQVNQGRTPRLSTLA